MKLLLHACCAPCSTRCVEVLRDEGIEPVLYWYNPNIHPYTEYRSRLDSLISFAEMKGLKLERRDEYGLRFFLAAAAPERDTRCPVCYRMRLEATAAYAAEKGHTHLCTTLLISPYQNHDLICTVAREICAKYGLIFLERDFRPCFRQSQKDARELGLYRQKYCGCIFSEEERYLNI